MKEYLLSSKKIISFEKYLRDAEKSENTIEKYIRDVRAFAENYAKNMVQG